ncbi:MAG: acylphosphatase [Fimbriimonadaceae bacterium]
MITILVEMKGKVQGVGFRAFIERSARIFRITGEVWNCSDGSVKAYVQHADSAHIDAFIKLIQDGPAEVESIKLEPITVSPTYETFKIAPTR